MNDVKPTLSTMFDVLWLVESTRYREANNTNIPHSKTNHTLLPPEHDDWINHTSAV